jgi:hypothetical protein
MTRVLLLGVALLTVACGNKLSDGMCALQVPPSAACQTACDSSAGAPNTCPAGFHCAPEGKCDALCTPTGNQCGDGYTCTDDGNCMGNGNGGGGVGDPPVDANCPTLHFQPTRITPTVELLLDQSGSMTADYGGGLNRWDALRKALIDPATGVVATLGDKVVFGATLYSNKSRADASGKQVGIQPCPTLTRRPRAPSNFTAIQQLLQGANPIEDTPTPESIDAVVADFGVNKPGANSPPIIVLATDGLPDTCADADPPTQPRQDAANAASVLAAQRAFTAGIKLFFLFVGDDQAGTHPQQMANAGAGLDPVTGRAPFFVATNPADLASAFQTIIGGVLSCDMTLSRPVNTTDGQGGTVKLDDVTLTYGTDWTLDADGITIHLLGAACNKLKTEANPSVDAAFTCGAVIF